MGCSLEAGRGCREAGLFSRWCQTQGVTLHPGREERIMKRRTFCVSAAAALGAAAFPFGRAFTAVSEVTADVAAVSGDGRKILLRAADVDDFRAGLRGDLLLREAAGYDDARKIFNGMFDRHPALIARCAGAADVIRAVKFAKAH